MKILICPDTFKGTLTAMQASEAILKGIKKAMPDVEAVLVPMADGGFGTLDVVERNTECIVHRMNVHGPLGKPMKAKYLTIGNLAFIEMAQCAGLLLLDKLDPMNTTTYGVGQLLDKCRGAEKIIIGLGGSGTNDCGIGMAQALGYRFLDRNGNDIIYRKEDGYCAGSLKHVEKIITPILKLPLIEIASDVNNPLFGPKGAVQVYGPQKGLSPEEVVSLDKDFERFAGIIKRDMGKDVAEMPGAGAAGGLGAGLIAFCDAQVKSGIDVIKELAGFDDQVSQADLIVTGEGRIDFQTAHGKTINGIINSAKKYNKPVIAIGGCLGKGWEEVEKLGAKVFDSSNGKSFTAEELKRIAKDNLVDAAYKAIQNDL